MGNDLIGPQLQAGQPAKSGLQSADEFGFQLIFDLLATVILLHIAAHIGIEQQRVCDLVGIHAGAAHGHINVQADLVVHNPERNGIGRAELVVDQLLGVEIVHPLILTGIAAVGKALADGLEGFQNGLAQLARKNAGLCRAVVSILAGLGTDFHHLALLHDHHTLAVSNGNAGAVGDDIIGCFGVGGTAADTLDTLGDQHIRIHGIAVEKFLPLVG